MQLTSGPLALRIFLPSLPEHSLSFRYRSCVVDVSIEAGHPTVICFLHFAYLWLSVIVSFCYKGGFFGEGWKLHLYVSIKINI